MKKLIYLVSFLFTVLLAGCDDFLTVESPDFSTDKYWRDKADVEAGLSAVYGQLDNRTGAYTVAEVKYVVETFRSDEMATGQDVNNYPEWGELHNYTYNNENSSIRSYWMNNYNGINYATMYFLVLKRCKAQAKR